jgi:hypothetical protein
MSLTVRKGAYIAGTVQNLATSGTSSQSSAVGSTTTIIRIAVNQDTYVAFGASPTATSANMIMPAGAIEFFAVTPGVTKVAVLQVGTAGIASIVELA